MPPKTKFYSTTLLLMYKYIRGVILFFIRNNHHEFKGNKMVGLKQLRISSTRTLILPEYIQTVRSGTCCAIQDIHISVCRAGRNAATPASDCPGPQKNFLTRAPFPPETVNAAPKNRCRIHARAERTRPLTGACVEGRSGFKSDGCFVCPTYYWVYVI